MDIPLPSSVIWLIAALERGGYETFAVGGCVRDSLLSRSVHDWDLTTSARPEEMRRVLEGRARLLDTGVRYGTVTAVTDDMQVEITTFREDGQYIDHRRPETVTFSPRLEKDLMRRDFTVNAMAYSPKRGLIDPFFGRADLEAGVLRTVGPPELRFSEDPLRILRGVRFYAALRLRPEPAVKEAMIRMAPLLAPVSRERCTQELIRILMGEHATEALCGFPLVIGQVVPQVLPAVGFPQNNRHHIFDVWTHTAYSVGLSASDPVVRLAMLLHDLGKPECYTEDSRGEGHFYGHASHSARLAKEALSGLRVPKRDAEAVLELVKHHDDPIPATLAQVRQSLRKFGPKQFPLLLQVKRADNLAQNPLYSKQEQLDRAEALLGQVMAEGLCYSVRGLAVSGCDLPVQGPELGRALEELLDRVIRGILPNEREALIKAALEIAANKSPRLESGGFDGEC